MVSVFDESEEEILEERERRESRGRYPVDRRTNSDELVNI